MDKGLEEALADGRSVKVRPLAEAVNLSANSFYEAVKRGEVKAVRIGKTLRIPNAEARRLLGLNQAEVV